MDYPELLAAYDSLETKYEELRKSHLRVSVEYMILLMESLSPDELVIFKQSQVYGELFDKFAGGIK